MRRGAISLFFVLFALRAPASTVLVSDSFETYALGELNKNGAGSANAAPNGSGNPWWGPFGGTLIQTNVVTAQNGVTPHSGTQMIAGASANTSQSNLWENLAYRFNGGKPYTGNLTMTFWFYDPNGASNGVNFAGNGGLAYYNTNSTTADYPSSQTLNSSTTIDRLSVGGAPYTKNTAGYPQVYNSTEYQARIVGSPLGYTSNGWVNLPITRSVGWHEAKIVVGSASANGADPISFYIDDLNTPLLTTSTVINQGYTDMELGSGPDSSSSGTNAGSYFDDVTLAATPEPASLALISLAWMVWPRRRQRGENERVGR